MRKLLTILLLTTLACSEDEPTACYTCKVTHYVLDCCSSAYTSTTSNVERCGITQQEATTLQQSLITKRTLTDGTVLSTRAVCSKK